MFFFLNEENNVYHMWWYWTLSNMCSKSLVHWLVHFDQPCHSPITLAYLNFPEYEIVGALVLLLLCPPQKPSTPQLFLLGLFLNIKFLESSYLISLSIIALLILSSHLFLSLFIVLSSHWYFDIYFFIVPLLLARMRSGKPGLYLLYTLL